MNPKKLLTMSAFAGALALSTAALAATNFSVQLNVGPPASIYEAVPAPRPGYVWAPGYWDVKSNRHVWVSGHWERQRHGYYYAEPRWTQHGNKWTLERGQWNKGDRDHDGVANAYDRAPNDPYKN